MSERTLLACQVFTQAPPALSVAYPPIIARNAVQQPVFTGYKVRQIDWWMIKQQVIATEKQNQLNGSRTVGLQMGQGKRRLRQAVNCLFLLMKPMHNLRVQLRKGSTGLTGLIQSNQVTIKFSETIEPPTFHLGQPTSIFPD